MAKDHKNTAFASAVMLDGCSNQPFVLDSDIAGPGTRYSSYIVVLILALIPRNYETLHLRQTITSVVLVQALACAIAALIQTYNGTLDLLHSMLAFQLVLIMFCEGWRIGESLPMENKTWQSPKLRMKKIHDILSRVGVWSIIVWMWHAFSATNLDSYGPPELSICNEELVFVVWFKSVHVHHIGPLIIPLLFTNAGLHAILLQTYALVGFWCILILVGVLFFLRILPLGLGHALLGRSNRGYNRFNNDFEYRADPQKEAAEDAGYPALLRLAIALYRIAMLELTLKRNWHMIKIEGTAWGYGQIVSMIALIAVLYELTEPILKFLQSPKFQEWELPTIEFWCWFYSIMFLILPISVAYVFFLMGSLALSKLPLSSARRGSDILSSKDFSTWQEEYWDLNHWSAYLVIVPIMVLAAVTLGVQFTLCWPLLQLIKLAARVHSDSTMNVQPFETIPLMDTSALMDTPDTTVSAQPQTQETSPMV